jgi:hypothetical protein
MEAGPLSKMLAGIKKRGTLYFEAAGNYARPLIKAKQLMEGVSSSVHPASQECREKY